MWLFLRYRILLLRLIFLMLVIMSILWKSEFCQSIFQVFLIVRSPNLNFFFQNWIFKKIAICSIKMFSKNCSSICEPTISFSISLLIRYSVIILFKKSFSSSVSVTWFTIRFVNDFRKLVRYNVSIDVFEKSVPPIFTKLINYF